MSSAETAPAARGDDSLLQVAVDRQRCTGHGRCHFEAAALFPVDDEGYLAVDTVTADASQRLDVMRAVDACPERALSISGG